MSAPAETPKRKPVFFRPPYNWSELTDEEKHAWAAQVEEAIVLNSADEDLPPALVAEKRRLEKKKP